MIFFSIAVFLIGSWLLLDWLESLEAERLRDACPPISDDEFLARCAPGIPRSIALGVRRLVSESLDVPSDSVYPEHRIVEDLGAE